MKRSSRLQIVLQLAARKEEAALQKLQRAQQELDAQTQRLQDLKGYQQTYLDNLRGSTSGANLAQLLTAYQKFLGQLAGALEQQTLMVENARRQMLHYQGIWLDLHNRHKGMGDFIDRCRVEENVAEEKKLQQQLDEAAQRPRRRT